MSRELVYVVSLDEVSRIRLRCRKCQFVESLPAQVQLRSFNGVCRNCGMTWVEYETESFNHIIRFLRAMRDLPEKVKQGLACEVELEIAEESEPDPVPDSAK